MGLTAQIIDRRYTLFWGSLKPIGQVGLTVSRVAQSDFRDDFLDHAAILTQPAAIYRDFNPYRFGFISPLPETNL
jgi:hypothetical protein